MFVPAGWASGKGDADLLAVSRANCSRLGRIRASLEDPALERVRLGCVAEGALGLGFRGAGFGLDRSGQDDRMSMEKASISQPVEQTTALRV